MIVKRIANFEAFQSVVESRSDVFYPLHTTHMSRVSNFAMPIVCRDATFAKRLCAHFEQSGVEVRPVIAGDMSIQPFYKKYAEPQNCPNTKIIHEQGFYFGNNAEMTDQEIEYLCTLLSYNG
jgi:CDP-6-deoxy-D-xylo-4-hexulose-3-dehydrase